jgi:Zn-dependent metalloprotease
MLGCTTRKQFLKHNRFCAFNDEITPQERTLTLTVKEDSLLLQQASFMQEDNEQVEIFLYKHPNDGSVTIDKTDKKTSIRKTLIYEEEKLVGSFFLYTVGDLVVGKNVEYNAEGEISKMTDHTQSDKYPICFKEAIRLVERKIGKKDSVFGIDRAKAIRKNDTLYYWNIYVDEVNNKPSRTIWIYDVDAATGRIIKKRRSVRAQGW